MSGERSRCRNTTLVLGIIIAILVCALAGALYYSHTLLVGKDSQIADLQNQNRELQDQINTLKSWLAGNRTSYEEKIGNLQKQIADMQSQIDELQKQVGELRSIVNLEETVKLEKDKTVNLMPRSSLGFSYDTPYAGYITITFTATLPVELWVGSSSTTPTYYFNYISNATYESITIPVTRGTTYIVFENPHGFGVTITYTITYRY